MKVPSLSRQKPLFGFAVCDHEVPASDRFSTSGVAGTWFGTKHPNMSLFVKKFVEHLSSLGSMTWQVNSTTVSSKVYAMCCCIDALTQAAVQNQVQFNRYFGCPWCMVAGEHIEGNIYIMHITLGALHPACCTCSFYFHHACLHA